MWQDNYGELSYSAGRVLCGTRLPRTPGNKMSSFSFSNMTNIEGRGFLFSHICGEQKYWSEIQAALITAWIRLGAGGEWVPERLLVERRERRLLCSWSVWRRKTAQGRVCVFGKAERPSMKPIWRGHGSCVSVGVGGRIRWAACNFSPPWDVCKSKSGKAE